MEEYLRSLEIINDLTSLELENSKNPDYLEDSTKITNEERVYGIPFNLFVDIASQFRRYDLLAVIAEFDKNKRIDKFELIDNIDFIPFCYLSDSDVITYLFDKGRFADALYCLLTDEDFIKYGKELKRAALEAVEKMEGNSTYRVFYNEDIFEEILRTNKINLLNSLMVVNPKDISTPKFDKLISDNKENLYSYLKGAVIKPADHMMMSAYLLNSPVLFEYVRSLNDLDTLSKFHPSLLGEDFINEHIELIVKNDAPYLMLINNEKIIDIIFRMKKYIYIPYFTNYLTQDMVNQYGKEFFDEVSKKKLPTSIYSSNKYFFNYVLQNGPLEYLKKFSPVFFTDELCEQFYEIINKYGVVSQYSNSKYMLLRTFQANPYNEILADFDGSSYTSQFVYENFDKMLEVATQKNIFSKARPFLEECLKRKCDESIIFSFAKETFTDEIITNNLDYIMTFIGKDYPFNSGYFACGGYNVIFSSLIVIQEAIKKGDINALKSLFLGKSTNLETLELIIKENLEKIMSIMVDDVPNIFRKSNVLFEECCKQKRFNLYVNFDEQFFTEEFIKTNLDFIMKNLTDKIPYRLRQSQVLFDEVWKQKKIKLLFDFNNSFFTEEFIKSNLELIMNNIGDYLPMNLRCSQILFNECFRQKRLNLLTQFDRQFFTEEFIKNNIDFIVDNLTSEDMSSFRKSQILFDECFKRGKFKLLFEFDTSLLTEEFIKNNLELIMNNLLRSLPIRLQNSKVLFDECVKQKKFNLLVQFDRSLLTEEFVKDNLEFIMFNMGDNVPYNLRDSQVIFDECLKRRKFMLIDKFNRSFYTEKFIKDNLELIMKNISDYMPYNLRNSQILFNEFYKKKDFNILIQFNNSLLSESFIEKNIDFILNNLKDNLPPNLQKSQVLFKELVKRKKFSLILQFDRSLLTEEFIKNNIDYFKNNILSNVPSNLKTSQALFNAFLADKRIDLVAQFDRAILTEEIIANNIEDFMKYITTVYMPYNLTLSFVLFNEAFRQKKFDLLMLFSSSFFTEKFISDNKEYIMMNITDSIPSCLRNSKLLFNEYLSKKNFKLLVQFSDLLVTEKFIKDNLDEIINNLNGEKLPKSLQISKLFFDELLAREKDDTLVKMDSSLFTIEVLEQNYDYFVKLYKNNPLFVALLGENRNFRYVVFDKKDSDIIVTLPFDLDILNNQPKLAFYSEMIGISEKELVNKIRDLLKINDEILNTLCPFMLSYKMNCLSFKNIEKLSIYPDIQMKLHNFSQKELMILNRILNYLDNELDKSYDLTTIIYYILTNWSLHKELIATIDSNSLTNEQIANLIFVLQRKNDFYNIKTMDDLEPTNFDKLTNEVFNDIQERVLNENISIEELRRAVFEKKYGIDLESAEFINKRYCQDMDVVKESSGLSERNRIILQSINYILTVDDVKELSFIYLTSTRLVDSYCSFIDLEAQIRSDYAKKYSESLYRIKEENLMKKEDFAESSLYEKVSNVTYKGKKPKFYVLDGDFNLQIHVLGAYRYWERPANFKDDWERPKIAYHGICTSYIGNNQIANARQSHPAYGFDSYEADALLAIQDSDIFSDKLISQFASSIYQPCCFYPPKEMIDKTRHTHNEFVLERRNGRDGNSFKRLPSYVVYIVDDINNETNFDMEKNKLFNETVQAAIDNDIPIVIVDRLKYAKSEKQKYEALLEKFMQQPSPMDMKDILLIVCNNMIGCEKYDTQPDMAYHTYFNQRVLTDVIDKIIEIIQKQPKNVRGVLIAELYKISLKEPLIKDENKTKIEQLYNSLNLVNNSFINEKKSMLRKIQDYYKSASSQIKEEITKDLNSGVTYEDIYQKIVNDEYKNTIKL